MVLENRWRRRDFFNLGLPAAAAENNTGVEGVITEGRTAELRPGLVWQTQPSPKLWFFETSYGNQPWQEMTDQGNVWDLQEVLKWHFSGRRRRRQGETLPKPMHFRNESPQRGFAPVQSPDGRLAGYDLPLTNHNQALTNQHQPTIYSWLLVEKFSYHLPLHYQVPASYIWFNKGWTSGNTCEL